MQLKRSVSPDWSEYLEIALGLLALWLTVAFLAGWPLPLLSGDRAAIFALATLGFGMCTLRLGATLSRLGWRHPLTLVGAVLGLILLLAIVALLSGAVLPFSERVLFFVVAVGLFAKWGLGLYARRAGLPAA